MADVLFTPSSKQVFLFTDLHIPFNDPSPGPITDEEHTAHLTPKLANLTSDVDTDSAPERSLASETSENDSTTSKDQYHIKHTSSSMTDLTAVSVDKPHQP